MLKVTNHGHQRRAQQKHQTRTNTNCRESIFRWIFCLLSMAGRTLLLYEPLQCVPGGAIKYHQKREKFLRPQFILLAFSLELCVKKCKIISFFGVFFCYGDCMKSTHNKYADKRKWVIHGNCHPALFVIVIYFLVSSGTETERYRDAIMLAWVSKLIMCDWKRTVKALNLNFGRIEWKI